MRLGRILGVGALLLAGIGAGPGVSKGDEPGEPLKVVVHVNFSDAERQGAGMKNLANILKDAPDTLIEVVCHGAGISLVETAHSSHAEAVATLSAKGVRFLACENTMRQKSIRKEDLLDAVGTVPSGVVEVIRKQIRDGYAYFKP